MSSTIDVISFLEKFQKEQKHTVQDQVPLLLFPRLIELGFSFLASASLLQANATPRVDLSDLPEPIILDVFSLTTEHGIKIRRESFNNSIDNMNLYYNGMIKNFMVDFSNSFGSGYHISNCFDGSIESLDFDERTALFIYFKKLGVSIIFHSFLFLGQNFPAHEEFQKKLREYVGELALRIAGRIRVAA